MNDIMSMLRKPKKTKPLMIRLSKALVNYIDGQWLKTYSSRPDYIISSIREYLNEIIAHENLSVLTIEREELSDETKRLFYYEYMKKELSADKARYSKWEGENAEIVEVLLSIMPGTIEDINRAVERTKFFKNHQEFIKVAIAHSIHRKAINQHIEESVKEFLENPQHAKKMEEEHKEILKILKKDNWEEELLKYDSEKKSKKNL